MKNSDLFYSMLQMNNIFYIFYTNIIIWLSLECIAVIFITILILKIKQILYQKRMFKCNSMIILNNNYKLSSDGSRIFFFFGAGPKFFILIL